ncbi:MAG: Septum formation protein Maf [Crocinitomicaceae bacterium]|jgi:septum formation protein|nr:Septum formation protein Maf [Crocinitomicaceae bacterium]
MFIKPEIKLVLGSKSPRRQELIRHITSNFEIRLQDVDEDFDPSMPVENVPGYLAQIKAEALADTLEPDEIIVSADTVVVLQNEILGKPQDAQDAKNMLARISGQKHTVITGCCLRSLEKEHVFSVHTDVYFNTVSPENIAYYVEKHQPMDKAGSYGIQEWIGVVGISRIDGCFYNVMGLPVSRLIAELQTF